MAAKNFSDSGPTAPVTWPEEKRCGHCKHLKPASQFAKDKSTRTGLVSWCKTCVNARAATPAVRLGQHERHLKRTYNLTLEDYEGRLAAQGGGCAICDRKPKGQKLHVDHDHSCCPAGSSCGKCVRGLLCSPCNHKILGYWLRESSKGTEQALATARRLVAYLEGGQGA